MYILGINALASLLDEPHRHLVVTQAFTNTVVRIRCTQPERCSEDARIFDIRSHPMLRVVKPLGPVFTFRHLWSAG